VQFAELSLRGEVIGDRDLQIAVTAMSLGYDLATLNVREFTRVNGLNLVDVSGYEVP
jgi:predicted nucleic acid-binding protein